MRSWGTSPKAEREEASVKSVGAAVAAVEVKGRCAVVVACEKGERWSDAGESD